MTETSVALEGRAKQKLRVAMAAAVVVGFLAARQFGVFHSFASPAVAAETFRRLGPWGYVVFIASYILMQPFGMPGTVFVVAATLFWPWHIAFALSFVGTMGASVVGFSFARFVARDWVAARIPMRFARYNEALSRHAFKTVFTLRFVFWMPPLLHAFFGVSKVRFWTHFWGSFAGYIVPLLVISYFGQKVFDALRSVPTAVWFALAVAIATVAFTGWLARRGRLKKAAS